jgi:nucleotide-binding universal stress UspA family protein
MFKKVLIATDGSELARKAVRAGLELAKALNADVTLVTVTEPWPVVEMAAQAEMGSKDPVGAYELLAQKGAQSTLDAAANPDYAPGVRKLLATVAQGAEIA